MEAIDIVALCLDRDLCITRFTPGLRQLIDVRADDVGRPLSDLGHPLAYDGLVDDAQTVLATKQAINNEVRGENGQWFVVGVRPMRDEDAIDGVVISFVDTTALKQTQRALEHEREYATDIVDTVWEPFLVLDQDLRVDGANAAFYATFEVEPKETVGRRVYDLGNGQWDIPELRTLLEDILPQQTTITNYDVEHEFEDIGWRTMRLNARRINHKQLILLAIEDVTERSLVLQQLREERNFVDRVLETVGALITVVDPEGRIVRFNKTCEEVSGYSSDEVIGKNVFDLLIPPEEWDGVQRIIEEHQQESDQTTHENHWITKDGEQRLIHWSSTVLRDADGELRNVIGTGIDITERRRLEREVISATDEERRRIGQDLHDMLASHLAGTAMMAQAFADRMERGGTVTVDELRRVVELLDDAGKQARSLSHSLMPLDVKGNELQAALRSLAGREEEMSGIPCSLEVEDAVPRLSEEVAAHLYRIASEAVVNAVKHAHPDAVTIRMGTEDERFVLTVRDNGTGITKLPDPADGIGVHMMRYRADLIGARLDIDSETDRGTTVRCSLPLDRLTASADE